MKTNLIQTCLLVGLLALPVAVHAQFTYTTNNGAITITGYTGPGGAVNIPDAIDGRPVTAIGNEAFGYCYTLTSVTIGDGVTSIGDDAFRKCFSLTTVIIGNSVTNIGDEAFYDCGALASVFIASDTPSVAWEEFYYLDGGGGVDLEGATVYYLSGTLGWTDYFAGLPTVMLNAPPQFGTTADGWKYVSDQSTIAIIAGYAGSNSAVLIPSTINGVPVTGIAAYAFDNNYNLTSVTIPNSVTSIGDSAFTGSGLTNVTIPDSVTNIGDDAFEYCYDLTNATIGNSVTSIGNDAFVYCVSLTKIYFGGNVPTTAGSVFSDDYSGVYDPVTAYYLPGTLGWSNNFAGVPTAQWLLPQPLILNQGPGFGVLSNQFGFTISWATNTTVVVEACTNLANAVWLPVSTNTLVNGSSYFSDPQPANLPGRFYRLRSP